MFDKLNFCHLLVKVIFTGVFPFQTLSTVCADVSKTRHDLVVFATVRYNVLANRLGKSIEDLSVLTDSKLAPIILVLLLVYDTYLFIISVRLLQLVAMVLALAPFQRPALRLRRIIIKDVPLELLEVMDLIHALRFLLIGLKVLSWLQGALVVLLGSG